MITSDWMGRALSASGGTRYSCQVWGQELQPFLFLIASTHTRPPAACSQVTNAIGDHMKVKVHACVGGTAVREDIQTLKEGVHIVVGTPGRVYDMIQRGALKLSKLKVSPLRLVEEPHV